MLERMAYDLIFYNSEKGLKKGTIYILDITDNPLSEETIKRIESYASISSIEKKATNIIYDTKSSYGLRTADLAVEKQNEFEYLAFLERNSRKRKEVCVAPSTLNALDNIEEFERKMRDYHFIKDQERLIKAQERLNSLRDLTSYFGILNIETLSDLQQDELISFLKDFLDLSKTDTGVKNYLS